MGDKGGRSNPTVKRVIQEIKELQKDQSDHFIAEAFEDNLFEWHFVIRGAPDTDFADGLYHGRILLPAEYPFKPPEFLFLTPNGRFQTQLKICLSISSHHPESWQPSWNIRTALTAIIAFMPTPGNGAVGAVDFPPEERRQLARSSHDFVPPTPNPERAAQMQRMHAEMLAKVKSGRPAAFKGMAELPPQLAISGKQPTGSAGDKGKGVESGQRLVERNTSQIAAKSGYSSTLAKAQAAKSPTAQRASAAGGKPQAASARAQTASHTRRWGGQAVEQAGQWVEQDKLGVTALCLGIMLAALLLRKVLRSYGLEQGQLVE